MTESQLDLVVAGTQDAVLMVESEAKELPEEVMLGAVMFGHRHFQPVIEAIIQLAEKAAKEPRDLAEIDNAALEKEMLGFAEQDLRSAYAVADKMVMQDGQPEQRQVKLRIAATTRLTYTPALRVAFLRCDPVAVACRVPDVPRARLLATADELLDGRWPVFALRRTDMSPSPDWFRDHKTGNLGAGRCLLLHD